MLPLACLQNQCNQPQLLSHLICSCSPHHYFLSPFPPIHTPKALSTFSSAVEPVSHLLNPCHHWLWPSAFVLEVLTLELAFLQLFLVDFFPFFKIYISWKSLLLEPHR